MNSGIAENSIVTSYTWHPSEEYRHKTNIARLMTRLGASTVDELRHQSVTDISGFWDAVVKDLGIEFRAPYSSVVDLSSGVPYAEWFTEGRLNIAETCLRRWATATPGADAVVHESEDGTVRRLTFKELDDQVARVASGLRRQGVEPGDAVGLYVPMIAEAVVATYAVASIGAVLVPLFSGFAPSAIAARLTDAGVKVVITADGSVRRGRTVNLLTNVDEAARAVGSLTAVVVIDNVGLSHRMESSNPSLLRIPWEELLSSPPQERPVDTAASDVMLLAYTSGTTGRPKGAVHTHAGFLVKVASEVAYGFDMGPGRMFCWVTDMGWIMGPLSIIGTHACGGALMLYEGAPDQPDADRLWDIVAKHNVTTLGVSPTLIRALRGSTTPDRERLTTVRVLGSTGEPWDPDSYDWLAQTVFGGRVPIINFSGGTEVGGSLLCPYPAEPIASCSLGGPALGMDVDVVDRNGVPVRGSIGELVCRQPWPSMTRGIWNDPDRYLKTYWSGYPGMWQHGDHALVDENGDWFILGRSDDVMNVAGKRLAPAEVESVLSADPVVSEAAVVGVPDPVKGEVVWAFWVANNGYDAALDTDVEARLRGAVANELGKPFAPARVIRVAQLPKTRSSKIMRRVIRAAVLGTDPGDQSNAEDPTAFDLVRNAIKEQ